MKISKPPKQMSIEDRELEAEIMFDIILTARRLGQAYYADDYGALTTEELSVVGRIIASGKALNDIYDTYLTAHERGEVSPSSPPTSGETSQPDLGAHERAKDGGTGQPAHERGKDDLWREGLA